MNNNRTVLLLNTGSQPSIVGRTYLSSNNLMLRMKLLSNLLDQKYHFSIQWVNGTQSFLFGTICMQVKIGHPCPQQTFRFIKNGNLQFFVFQKVWYIGVKKSVKLKKIFVRFLFYGYWKFVTSQRWKKTQKLMKIEKILNENLLNFVFRWF